MIKRLLSYITLLVLISFTFSCTVNRMISIDNIRPASIKIIFGLVTKNNEWIEFQEIPPAVLHDGFITGYTSENGEINKKVKISIKDVKLVWLKKWDFAEFGLNFIGSAGFMAFGGIILLFMVTSALN